MLPAATRQVLADREWSNVFAVGGRAAIGDDVYDEAREVAGVSDAPRRPRISGADRYDTSVAVAAERERHTGVEANTIVVATGANWPDALAAGPAAAERGSMFLLVRPDDLYANEYTIDWLNQTKDRLHNGWVSGGPAAVSEQVSQQLAELIRWR